MGIVGIVVFAVIVAAVFFVWGWTRAARYRAEKGKAPWGVSPAGWGVIHVVLAAHRLGAVLRCLEDDRRVGPVARPPGGHRHRRHP